ncbi:MAG: Hsp20/alpha crystallin family protein [Armatimonadota bacterium]|nr:Hsp20/alpha crystallin family protein [Armatimonadota bacterium]MDW8024626.1 Hsp20/alpha crystallin family protein [Armatimonadota bacterium]
MPKRASDIIRLTDRIDRVIDRLFGRWLDRWFEETTPEFVFEHTPPLDLVETADAYIARFEIPGAKREELEVTVQGKRLMVRGKKEHEEREERKGFIRVECYHGEFSRAVTLPKEVDADNATATYKDGILEVRLPKIEKEKGKKIEIKMS